MPLIDYFTAVDDAHAAQVLPDHGGPAELGFATLEAKGVDPAVALGQLESILTGRPYGEVTEAERQCQLLTDSDAEAFVVTVTDTLRDALAQADESGLVQAVTVWAATEELDGAEPAVLAGFLQQFAALARGAVEQGHHLYCWWSL